MAHDRDKELYDQLHRSLRGSWPWPGGFLLYNNRQEAPSNHSLGGLGYPGGPGGMEAATVCAASRTMDLQRLSCAMSPASPAGVHGVSCLTSPFGCGACQASTTAQREKGLQGAFLHRSFHRSGHRHLALCKANVGEAERLGKHGKAPLPGHHLWPDLAEPAVIFTAEDYFGGIRPQKNLRFFTSFRPGEQTPSKPRPRTRPRTCCRSGAILKRESKATEPCRRQISERGPVASKRPTASKHARPWPWHDLAALLLPRLGQFRIS